MNKKLLVYINNFHPDRGGGASVFTDMCVDLASRGFDVTVRCAYPYYPEWRDKSGQNGIRIERSEYKGMTLERHGLYIPSNPASMRTRLVHELSYLLSLLRTVLRGGKFDLVIAYCPSFASVIVGSIAKSLCGCRLWLNVQDIPADAASNIGLNTSGLLIKWLAGTQSFFFKRADIWTTISPVMRDRLSRIIQNQTPNLLVCNWLNQSMQNCIDSDAALTLSTKNNALNLLYAGNIGAKQGILKLCEILHESSAEFNFLIFGDGAEAENVKAWVSQVGDSRFQFSGFLSESDFVKNIKAADLFVITEKDGAGSSFIPSKLIPSISAGTPILAICNKQGPLGDEVLKHGLGPHFEWQETNKLLNGLEQGALVDEHQLALWSKNCLSRAQLYSRNQNLDRIVEIIQLATNRDLSKDELKQGISLLDL